MRRSKIYLPFLAFLLLTLVVSHAAHAQTDAYDWQKWGAVADTLSGVEKGKRVFLTTPFIVVGSDTVIIDGERIDRSRYEINYQRGLVRINVEIGDDAIVVVTYTRLPFFLSSVYSLREISFADAPEAVPPRPKPVRESQRLLNPKGNLVFGGVKSISFTVGSNTGTELDQTLRATIEGNLTNDIRVKALLSDSNLPIQPEGNTEELEYLDKVFVELSGPRAKATLGDFRFQNDYSNFSSFRRELKGASGEVRVVGKTHMGLAGGESKGVFRSRSFRGIAQLQGPYDLLPQGRVVGEVIIAGTERVYFDGEVLNRGQNRDYTIDYDKGTLTFTPRRLVTTDTEIAVDFEVTQEQYERTSVFGNVESADLPAGFKFQAMVARERDDSGRPKAVAITEGDSPLLEAAGDDPDLAVAGGITLVGPGNGDYVLVPPDTIAGTPEFFEFNDTLGTHDLVFVEIGVGKGDYLLDGITATGLPFYTFAGPGNGNYVIGKKLPLPQSHSIITARLAKQDSGVVDIDFQFNVSDFDANTLSSLGDGDNVGDAGELRIRLKKIPLPRGQLEFRGAVSTVNDQFRSFEKTRTWYFYRDWNLERDALVGREVLSKLATAYMTGKNLRLDYELGLIDRDNFDGFKHEGRLALARPGARDQTLNSRVFNTEITGVDEKRTRRHGAAGVSYGFWRILPSVGFTKEEFFIRSPVLPDSGRAFDRYQIKLATRHPDRFSYTLEAEERNTEQRADTTNGWIDARRDRTYGVSLASRGYTALQGELQYSHRVEDNHIVGDRRTGDLARLKGLIRISRIGFKSNVDYEISQNQFRSQKKSVIFVGEGKGDFNQLGEPVGKGRGDYTVIFLPTLETIPTKSVDLTLHSSWKNPSLRKETTTKSGVVDWIKDNVSLDQTLSVKEESTFDKSHEVYLLFPSALQRDESTLHGISSLRQDWAFLNGYPGLSLTFRYQRTDEEENRFNTVKEERFTQQQIVRVDRSITQRLSVNIEGRRELNRRAGKGLLAGTGSTYDVTGVAGAAGWGLRFSAGSSIDGEVEYRRQIDDESEVEERALAFKPRIVWRLTRNINVFGRYEITRFTTDDTGVKPFFFSNTGTSQRWGLTPNIKISKMISLLANYEGRAEDTFAGKRIVEHELRLETRAFF